jgi:murein DD-endopeptidase MepM/ murein hydrolase activator NlpD
LKSTFFLLLLFITSFSSFIEAQRVMDTVDTPYGKMLIYSNKTWSFFNKPIFDGIMNKRIHTIMSKDQDIPYTQSWNNEVCFTSKNNDLSKLRDTIWLNSKNDLNIDFKMPVLGTVTSRYGLRKGRNHNGIDISLKTGDTIYAVWSGKIRYAKYNDGGFGNLVIIRHHNGLETFSAHLSKFLVFPDQDVIAGEPIGLGGSTGRSSGPHLHFEIRFYEAPINPDFMIDFENKKLKQENLFVHKSLFAPGLKPAEFFDDSHLTELSEINDSLSIPIPLIKPPVVVQKPKIRYYRVKSGDTLTEIADRNNTTVTKLCQLNGIKPTSIIQLGKSLRIK